MRILYNVDHVNPIPVPPPPEPDVALISSLGVPSKAIAGVPDLMHHKFVVRDGESVWTGSMNWTDDSWSRQENVVITVDSAELAKPFTLDFEELWRDGDVERSGFAAEPRPVEVDGLRVRAWFTPGFAEALTHRIAKKVGRAEKVRICSPVITSAPVLATLAQRIADGKGDIAGCVDATQVEDVLRQWKAQGTVAWKIPLLQQVLAGSFSGKNSTPWAPGSLHDFMHAKVVVADDTVFVGSFNLSPLGRAERRERRRARGPRAGEAAGRVRRRGARALPARHSHSIVDGGFDVMSRTTRFTAGTSFTIRDEIVSSRS